MEVAVKGDEIYIADLAIEDPIVAALLADIPEDERPARLVDALEVGARVLLREQRGVQADYFKLEIERALAQIHADITSQLSASDPGLNPLADFKLGVEQAVTKALTNLGSHLNVLSESVDGLRQEQDRTAAVAAEYGRGTAKGRDFEELVLQAIAQIAHGQGDGCDGVGDVRGIAGKAGDVIVMIDSAAGPARGRIVFEAKTGRISRPEALRVLASALEQRMADYAVLVVPDEQQIPAELHPLREFDGNKMVCVLGEGVGRVTLETAYSLARARVLIVNEGVEGQGIDSAAVGEAVKTAVRILEQQTVIKSRITGSQSQLEEVKALIGEMGSSLRRQLETIARLCRAGDEEQSI